MPLPQSPEMHEGSSWFEMIGATEGFKLEPLSRFSAGNGTLSVVDAGAIACRSEFTSESPDRSVGGSYVGRTNECDVDEACA